jgi:two-component system, chemotaxis family, CheB/CheR fusion protein
MNKRSTSFPIVGIGASAGGIPAMEGMFRSMPKDPGAAFVIVTHLSPERESLLHEVVTRYTGMPVVVAEDGAAVEPDRVYVMPPNAIMTIAEGRLALRRPNAVNRERKPIDIFFSALGEDQGEYAVAVILSGGDGDGTLGAKVVKERGGLTLAQTVDASGPRNPDMPESAIASGVIDMALPVEEMGEKIQAFARSFSKLAELTEDDGQLDQAELEQIRQDIYGILRRQSGHDFSGYKTKTFMRRVRRRMQVLQLKSVRGYIEVLERDGKEVTNLFRDLLISVTNFFRDPDAFAALEKLVIPRLFEGRGPGDTVRIWIPACATGEEVYSVAILMREHMDRLTDGPRVQIFATDIDEPALVVARAARYPEPLLDGLTAERKKRFFTCDGASYVLANEVRELCIFSPHNVIRDPPFSRMDMVSCRNLLIYFGAEVQNRVIPTFHYALKPGGFLFLGTSESISLHSELFATLDKKNRVFQAREYSRSAYRLPVMMGEQRIGTLAPDRNPGRVTNYPLRQAIEAQVLEKFSPPHVVVDAEGNVVYYSGRTGRYLEAPQGVPSRQVLTMARKGLRLELRAALREAATTRSTITRDAVMVEDDEGRFQAVTLIVEPLAERSMGERLYLVLFHPVGPPQNRAEAEAGDHHDSIADLERELRDTRERLQSTIEEYETAIEELKSSNEELMSVNEEAQSTNEELEASKEEMQSLNEELSTINAELGTKVEELDRAHNDLRNLFESTRIATVFLDRNLVIRNFTPAASAFFSVREADIGRPLTDLTSKLDYPGLKNHIEAVFAAGEMLEHQLPRDGAGRHFLVRLIPYRSAGGRTDGVVVTLIDVTTLAEAEEHQQVLISELNHRVKNMLTVVISIANHTLEKAPTPEAFAEALTGRLQAMARGYHLLSVTNWKEAQIGELVQTEVELFDAERFAISGPEIKLTPQQGLSMAMVVHELATNAAKYGALSKAGGRVVMAWDKKDGRFEMDWKEIDGPPVKQAEHEGFGLFLIRGEIEYRMAGEVAVNFAPDGLDVRMAFPLKEKGPRDGTVADR